MKRFFTLILIVVVSMSAVVLLKVSSKSADVWEAEVEALASCEITDKKGNVVFECNGVKAEKEVKLEISYKGHKLDKIYYADFVCFESIIVELKAVSKLINAHKAQLINYLNAINKEVGLLINFGEASLKWQRITNFKVKDVSPEQIRVE